MSKNETAVRLTVLASLLVGMVLLIIPLPRELFVYNPDWVLLFLIYWSLAIPERVGLGYAWCLGLLVDALTGRMLGQHALAYSVVVYVSVKLHGRLRSYPLFQQGLIVFLLLLVNQLLVFLTQNGKAAGTIGMAYWLPSVVGALVWPVVFLTLRRVRRRYPVA